MASYRLSVKHIARGQGQSATAAASYRAGEKVRDEQAKFQTKAKHQDDLDNGVISQRFRDQLQQNSIKLSDKATVEKQQNRWVIEDGKQSYTVREHMTGKKDPKPQLTVYQNGEHDYTRKQQVLYSEIFVPDDAPQWASNRSDLWNTVEAADTHKNAWVAKEVQVSLPRELDLEQNKTLISGVKPTYVQK